MARKHSQTQLPSSNEDSEVVATLNSDAHVIDDLKFEITKVASLCNRGELKHDKTNIMDLVSQLEGKHSALAPSNDISGTWDCIYSSTYLFLSSPFFMAARAVCKDGEEAERFNFFCKLHREALLFTQIGGVKQIIDADSNSLVSEFESLVAAVPGLPVTIRGVIQSRADIDILEDSSMKIHMDTVRIKSGSSNIPVLRNVLDDIVLQTRKLSGFLESNVQSYKTPEPVFKTTYMDETFRISRNQDDEIFVYIRHFSEGS